MYYTSKMKFNINDYVNKKHNQPINKLYISLDNLSKLISLKGWLYKSRINEKVNVNEELESISSYE